MTAEAVLGKRARDDEAEDTVVAAAAEEDSDDEVGPMPMPANEVAVKKKRKGASTLAFPLL